MGHYTLRYVSPCPWGSRERMHRMKIYLTIIASTAALISSSCSLPAGRPAWQGPAFTPAANIFADRLVSQNFKLVWDLRKIDPAVSEMFFKTVPRRSIATGDQPFAMTDIDDGLPRRFVLAGRADDMWFILYEVGGRAYHHILLVYSRNGDRWLQAVAAIGSLEQNRFSGLVRAVKKGDFEVAVDNLNL